MSKQGYELNHLLGELNWFKEAKNWSVRCPKCMYHGKVSEFIQDPTEKISYYGFTLSKCPNCKESLKFDFEIRTVDNINKGRKPFPIMFGVGRIIDLFILIALFYFLISGKLFWLAIAYIALVVAGYAWELFLKKNDEIWYITDVLLEDMTDRIARVGLPLTIIKGVILVVSIYKLFFS